jgi:hypothetical protein
MHYVRKICLCHIPSDAEKQTETKTQTKKQAVMWQPKNSSHHIKRKNDYTFELPSNKEGQALVAIEYA